MIRIIVIAESGLTALTYDTLKISYDSVDTVIRRPEINCEGVDEKDWRGGYQREANATHIGVGDCMTETTGSAERR